MVIAYDRVISILLSICYSALLAACYDFHLHERTLRQGFNGHGGTCRERLCEELRINLVHGSEIAHVRQKDSGLHHIGEGKPSLFKNRFHIEKRLSGLRLDAAFRKCSGGRIDRKLPGSENESARLDSLTVRADCGRCSSCTDLFHN